jgi:hypothetical protein
LKRKNNLPFFLNQIIFRKRFFMFPLTQFFRHSGITGFLAGQALFCLFSLLLPENSPAQNRYDVLITEFLADPTPGVGLPESEFIELKNHSPADINLHNWKISNGSSVATIKTDFILKTDSFLIVCASASASAFSNFGTVLGVSGFPSLSNDEGEIILSTETGAVMHAIQYNRDWYNNEVKATGGWSLEMIDLSNPCTGKANWRASTDSLGGTPGKTNSVNAENPDVVSPSVVRAVTADSLHLILMFDEAIDSPAASAVANYTVSAGIGSPSEARALDPFFDRVGIRLSKTMDPGKIYSLAVQQIRDCSGNEISLHNTCKAGLALKAKSGDIIFNEILFNPPAFGYDYLEIFNRSSKIISCSELFLAGRESGGSLKDPVALVKEDRAFFPGDYLLLTENPEWILNSYPLAAASDCLPISAMPSLPDDQGMVVLLNASGEILDELYYDHHWHSPLLANEEGVSLERIRTDLPTSLASNWTSAAAGSGYGTPGYKNSESSTGSLRTAFISVDPKIFSPDADGYRDFCFINYHLPAAGFIGSVSIYDITGRLVRKLVNNIIWGIDGSFRWDGLDDQQNLLPTGRYIIYTELFLPDGTVKKQKTVCVLARKS